jgi:hypothetical protein
MRSGLFELRRYARKGAVELATETIYDRDNRNGNASGYKAVLNRGCRGLILAEPNKKFSHLQPLFHCTSRDTRDRSTTTPGGFHARQFTREKCVLSIEKFSSFSC